MHPVSLHNKKRNQVMIRSAMCNKGEEHRKIIASDRVLLISVVLILCGPHECQAKIHIFLVLGVIRK